MPYLVTAKTAPLDATASLRIRPGVSLFSGPKRTRLLRPTAIRPSCRHAEAPLPLSTN